MTSADFDPNYGYAPLGATGRAGGLGARFFARCIDGVFIAVTISGSPTKQGKHDELAGGTQVVKA